MNAFRPSLTAFLLLAAAGVSLAGPAAISTVTPTSLSLGTSIDVKGVGFGGGAAKFAAPRSWLTAGTDTHKIPLKVDAKTASDVEFHATLVAFRKGVHGTVTLHVQPKAKGAAELTSDAGLNLAIELPAITSLSASSGKGGDTLTITGTGFGAKKRKVRFLATIGSKSVNKVVPTKTWSDTSITLVVPKHSLHKGLTSLAGEIEVETDAGTSNTESFTVNG